MHLLTDIHSFLFVLSKIHLCGKDPKFKFLPSGKPSLPLLELTCCQRVISLTNFIVSDCVQDIINEVKSTDLQSCEDIELRLLDTSDEIAEHIIEYIDSDGNDTQESPEILTDTPSSNVSPETTVYRAFDSKQRPKIIKTCTNGLNPTKGKKHKYADCLICEYCAKKFTGKDRAYKFSYHMNAKHKKEIKYECPDCDKIFWGERELSAHINSHSSSKPMCYICGKMWSNQAQLNRHLRIHEKDKLFKCNVCDAQFKRSDHLRVHTRKHTGILPFKCKNCSVSYPQKRQLELHEVRCMQDKNDKNYEE